MNQLQVSSNNRLDLPQALDIDDELRMIVSESANSAIMREVSRYRIWRIRENDLWKEAKCEDGTPRWSDWDSFVEDMGEILGCGRQHIYDRMRIYDQLVWLGLTPEEIVIRVAQQEYLIINAMNKMIDWDTRNGKVRTVRLPNVTAKDTDEEQVKTKIKDVLQDLESFDTKSDAIRYVSETLVGEPQVDVWYDGGIIHLRYSVYSFDEDGNMSVDEYGDIKFYPDKDLPQWVHKALEKAMKESAKRVSHHARKKSKVLNAAQD